MSCTPNSEKNQISTNYETPCNETDLTEDEKTEQILETREEEKGELGTQKQITVLFASIKGFEAPPDADMDLIEEIHIRQNSLNNELDNIVSKYGGVIDKIIRGFFMATFGTKVSHKNDPVYAVLTAIELVEATQKYGGVAHVGINSGIAWVGPVGTTGFTDNTSFGDTVNLSARLKGEAADNQVLVSPDTYELTKDYFEYEPLSPVSVKGINEPVPVFAVEGETSKSETIATVKESEEKRLKRLQKSIPPYLREKALANKSRIQGERKPVTMLYSDVSGFTAMSEKFKDNPGQMAKIMDSCHKALGELIYKHEGRIDQIVGDELMAIFGAPITHEDDPERAIQAGLEMLQEIKRFSEEQGKKLGIPPLNVHIGVNSGRVSIGQISDDVTRMDYTVIGEPVELAEKLEDVSERGQMVVGERTYRLTRALFDFRKLESVEVGGRKENIYEVIGMKDKPSLKRGDERLNEVPPIGRDEEYHTLKELSDNLIDKGEGYFACMIGEAGLGKSRLKRELRTELFSCEFNHRYWLEGTCFAHTGNTAYSVFQSAIKSHIDIKDMDSDEEIREKLIREMNEMCESEEAANEIIPFIGNMLSVRFEGKLGDKVRFLENDPKKLQRRTFVAIRDWLIAESKRHPVVLVLEDLHWIDRVSVEAIEFLMEELVEYPILTLCLFRPERLHQCWAIRDAVEEKIPDKHTRITLNKLSPELSSELLNLLIDLEEDGKFQKAGNTEKQKHIPTSKAQGKPDNQQLVSATQGKKSHSSLSDIILEKSDGNPFYMEEILRNLMDDKVIVPKDPTDESNRTWVLVKDVAEVRVPDTIDQVMSARIDRLDDEPKLVLRQSSIIGRAFEYEILNGMAANEIEQIDENLSKLVSTDMIAVESDEPLEYQFSHIVTHNITYGSIPVARRKEYHNRVGLTIEDLHTAHLERFYERLAQQFQESNNDKKAAIYLTKAGTKARKQFSNDNAITFYQQALERLEDLPELIDEMIECHEGLGDIYSLTGKYGLAIEHYQIPTQEGLKDAKDAILRARIKRKSALVYYKQGKFDTALDFYDEAREEMGDKPDSAELARIYNGMSPIYGYIRAEWPKAFEISQKAVDLIGDAGNYDVVAATYKDMGRYKYRLGEKDEATEYFKNALKLATQIGDKLLMARLHNNLAFVDRQNATSHYEKSIALKEQMGDVDGILTTYMNIGRAHSTRGEISQALEYFNKSLEISEEAGAAKLIATVHNNIASAYSRAEDYQRALKHYDKSLEICQEIGDEVEIPVRYANICDTYIKMNEIDEAMEMATKTIESAEKVKVVRTIATVHYHLGRIYHAKGQYDDSLKEFEKAMEIAEEAKANQELAWTSRYLGEMLIDKGNIKKAKESLNRALKLYKEREQQGYAEEVEEILLGLTIDD